MAKLLVLLSEDPPASVFIVWFMLLMLVFSFSLFLFLLGGKQVTGRRRKLDFGNKFQNEGLFISTEKKRLKIKRSRKEATIEQEQRSDFVLRAIKVRGAQLLSSKLRWKFDCGIFSFLVKACGFDRTRQGFSPKAAYLYVPQITPRGSFLYTWTALEQRILSNMSSLSLSF